MTSRFSGPEGRRHLIDALQGQQLLRGCPELAQPLADIATVESFDKGAYLITQGRDDNDMFLLLSGRVSVVINKRPMRQRAAGTHVGEMSLIERATSRSASCIALEPTDAARVREPEFTTLTDAFPVLWRNLARVLGDRLRERTQFVRERNDTPIVFIGSSRESLPIANAIEAGLTTSRAVVRVWPKGIFMPSHFPIEDLERELDSADFAVLVFGPDDRTLSRGVFKRAPRDNVVFEAGLFMGALRRQRTLIVQNRNTPVKIPSDLSGLTPIVYEDGASATLTSRLQSVCAQIEQCVDRHGAR